MTIGTLVSSLLVGPFGSKFGRKAGLWTASILNLVSTAIMVGTTSVGALYFARLLLGESLRLHCRFGGTQLAHVQQDFPSAGCLPSRNFTSTKWHQLTSEALLSPCTRANFVWDLSRVQRSTTELTLSREDARTKFPLLSSFWRPPCNRLRCSFSPRRPAG